MAWTTPGTAVAGDVLTAARWNSDVRDNTNDLDSRVKDSGLVVVTPTSVSGTGVTSTNGQISLSSSPAATINGVFSATYSHYRVVIDAVTSTAAAQDISFRLTASGTPNSTSGNYYFATLGLKNDGTSSNAFSGTTATSFELAVSGTGLGRLGYAVDLFNPFASERTSCSSIFSFFNTSTTYFTRTISGGMTVTTSYDGFYFAPIGSGNLTGSIRVYGYQNS